MNRNKPQSLSNVLSELIARRGIGRSTAAQSLGDVWCRVVGEGFADWTRAAGIRRGVLEVTVADSTTVQELMFRKGELLSQLGRELPEARIKDLRFRVGPLT